MATQPPAWSDLAELSRGALGKCQTIRASLNMYGPAQADIWGAPSGSSVEVWFAAPDLWRLERDGELQVLRDESKHLKRSDDGMTQQPTRSKTWKPVDELGGLGWAHRSMFRSPAAFRQSRSRPAPIVVAGRDAWEVNLSAPDKKPYPLRVAIDAKTGLVLRYVAEGTPYFTEVVQIAVDEALPSSAFTFQGFLRPYRPPVSERAAMSTSEGLWAWLSSTQVDDGDFPECDVGGRVRCRGLRLNTTSLTPGKAGDRIERVRTSRQIPTYRIRGRCRGVLDPMTLLIGVDGLDVIVQAPTWSSVPASPDGQAWKPNSEHFAAVAPGQWVEAEGQFHIPWTHEWDVAGRLVPQRNWMVADVRVNRRRATPGVGPGTQSIKSDSDARPSVRQWASAKSFWVKLTPTDETANLHTR